jgi:hypothetical protein
LQAFEECKAKGLMMVSKLFSYELMRQVRTVASDPWRCIASVLRRDVT